MNLKNGTTLFKQLVRAKDLQGELWTLTNTIGDCDEHGEGVPHYSNGWPQDSPSYDAVCVSCVDQSRALSHIGRAGGRKGGRSLSPRKLEQLRAASQVASDRAAERRVARDETGDSHE